MRDSLDARRRTRPRLVVALLRGWGPRPLAATASRLRANHTTPSTEWVTRLIDWRSAAAAPPRVLDCRVAATESDIVADIQSQLRDRLHGVADVFVTPPRIGETACNAAVAYGSGGTRRGREFPFRIAGRTATDLATDLYNQIVSWMEAIPRA
jgi:hypothetical protein